MLPALIPFLTFLLLALLVFLRSRLPLTLRESFLISATLCTAWLILSLESLSYLHAITFLPVLLYWLIPLLILLPFLLHALLKHKPRFKFPRLHLHHWLLLAALLFIFTWSFLQAIISPPNNVDSNEYHLQRQVFWLQQHSLENYPTNNPRQLAMPPLTEYAGTTLMLLSGNDRFHNLVQWLAFLLATAAATLITRRFNSSLTAQLLAAIWVATIPLAFMQASTTKNDVAVMFWLLLALYWVLLLNSPSRLRWLHILLLALACGAAALTKGTAVIFALPLAPLALFYLFRHHWLLALPAALLIAIIALALNAPFLLRNSQTFHSLAPDSPGIHGVNTVGNEDHSLPAVTSNFLRLAASHFVTPSQTWNDGITQFVRDLHAKLSRDVNDPHTTWLPGGRYLPYQFRQNDEDKAAAPAHMLLTLLLPLFLLFAIRRVPWKTILAITLVFFAATFLFCLLLKWQNWHVRLIIALPALLAPIFGWTFSAPRLRYLAALPVLFLLITLIPSFNSIPRPLFGPNSIFYADRLALRYYNHPDWAADYRQLANRIAAVHPQTVGFMTPLYSPDYPMQRLLLDTMNPPPTFTSFNGFIQIPGRPELDPDVLLTVGVKPSVKTLTHDSTGSTYHRAAQVGRYSLWFKD